VASTPSGDPGIHVARIASKEPPWLNPRWLLVAGAVAITLGFFSIFSAHASQPLITLRQELRWQSTTTMVFSAPVVFGPSVVGPGPTLTPLAHLYAHLAMSEPVVALARRDGPLNGSYHAEAVSDVTHHPLPALRIEGVARTHSQATKIAQRISLAFTTYVRQKQDEAGIPKSSRVRFSTVGVQAARTANRHFIVPLMILAVVLALLAAAGLSVRAQRR